MDTPYELAELRERDLRLVVRGLDERGCRSRVRVELLAGETEIHREGDETGLCSVVQVALDPLELVLLGNHRAGAGALELLDALVEARREQDSCEARLALREAGADPRGEDGGHDPKSADEERPPPTVDGPESPIAVVDAQHGAVRRDPPPERDREHPERDRPEHDRGKAGGKADDGQRDEPAVVLPGLRVARHDPDALPKPGPRHVAVVPTDGLAQQKRRPATLDIGEPAVHVRRREEDGEADEGDEERDAEREERHEHDEGRDAHREAEEEVDELAPRCSAERAEDDGERAHAAHATTGRNPAPCGERPFAVRLSAPRIDGRDR